MSTWFIGKKQIDFTPHVESVIHFNKIAGKKLDHDFQMGLIKEEFKELKEAFDKKDKANFLKELCDMFVVCSYMWPTHHRELYRHADEYWFRYKPNSVKEYLDRMEQSFSKWQLDIYTCTLYLLNEISADTEAALSRVCKSNMSKFTKYDPEESVELYAKHCEELKSDRYPNVEWDVNNGMVVWKSGEGKILKGPQYFECSLLDLV